MPEDEFLTLNQIELLRRLMSNGEQPAEEDIVALIDTLERSQRWNNTYLEFLNRRGLLQEFNGWVAQEYGNTSSGNRT
jgi:hypothetical protein